jgi:hypothetical protein
MDKTPIDETPLPRIRRNVSKLSPKILTVANPMLMKSHLPYFPGKLRPHFMREPALDALGAALNCLVRRRRQQDMQMFGHHREAMQLITPLFPIVEERVDQQFGMFCYNKQRSPLIRRCRKCVSFHFGS